MGDRALLIENDMFDEKTCALLAPTVAGGVIPLSMKRVYDTESRIQEVAFVNAQKAPELLATFNIGYLDLNDHLCRLELLIIEANKAANKRKSIVLLDEVPRILKEKGIWAARSPAGSEDQRQAILDQDEDYVAAMDRVGMLKAMSELLEGKRKGLEWAFTSVKKILGGSTDWRDLNQNRNLSHGELPDGAAPGATIDPNSPRAKFGAKAR